MLGNGFEGNGTQTYSFGGVSMKKLNHGKRFFPLTFDVQSQHFPFAREFVFSITPVLLSSMGNPPFSETSKFKRMFPKWLDYILPPSVTQLTANSSAEYVASSHSCCMSVKLRSAKYVTNWANWKDSSLSPASVRTSDLKPPDVQNMSWGKSIDSTVLFSTVWVVPPSKYLITCRVETNPCAC